MPFMVVHRRSDGSSAYQQSDAIDEAALFVERLRNSDGIDQIRIYRMEEISFAFRPYFKVELGLPERQGRVAPRPVNGAAAPAEASDAPESRDGSPGHGDVTDTASDDASDDGVTGDGAPGADPSEVVEGAQDEQPAPPGSDHDVVGTSGRRGLFGR